MVFGKKKKTTQKKAKPKYEQCVEHKDKDGNVSDRPSCVICARNRELAQDA